MNQITWPRITLNKWDLHEGREYTNFVWLEIGSVLSVFNFSKKKRNIHSQLSEVHVTFGIVLGTLIQMLAVCVNCLLY